MIDLYTNKAEILSLFAQFNTFENQIEITFFNYIKIKLNWIVLIKSKLFEQKTGKLNTVFAIGKIHLLIWS